MVVFLATAGLAAGVAIGVGATAGFSASCDIFTLIVFSLNVNPAADKLSQPLDSPVTVVAITCVSPPEIDTKA